MKTYIGIVLSVLVIGLMTSCTSQPNKASSHGLAIMGDEDSLKVLDSLFSALRKEVYEQSMYQIHKNDKYIGCNLQQFRYRLSVQVNKRGQVMVRGELDKHITSSIIEFYTTNLEKNDLTNNYPPYSRITLKELEYQVKRAISQAEEVEKLPDFIQEIVDFKWKQAEEWKTKLEVLKTLNRDELSEPYSQAGVYLDYQDGIDGNALVDSVLLAFYTLRDRASERYFDESYLELFYRHSVTNSTKDKSRLSALKVLHPLQVIDEPYCRENDIWYGEEEIVVLARPVPEE